MSDPLRVLHAPVNIANQPWHLSRAERTLGCKSDLVINYGTWLQIPADEVLSKEYGDKSPETVRRRREFCERAPRDYDVLHYYFGRTLACWDDYGPRNEHWFSDLYAAKKLGKKVFMTLQGCDARLAAESNRNNAFTPCGDGRCSAYRNCIDQYDAERRWLIENILPLCDNIFYLNPELGHFVDRGVFLPYASADWRELTPVPPTTKGPIRIVHGPSDPNTKGSPLILAALDKLKSSYDIELILVKGKPHAEAMQLYSGADIAIDQILYGWYGGFAVELMALGKPVLCHIREQDRKYVPPDMLAACPIRDIRPTHLEEDIAKVLDARAQWTDWSDAGLRFVKSWHDPQLIARAMVGAYRAADSRIDLSDLANAFSDNSGNSP